MKMSRAWMVLTILLSATIAITAKAQLTPQQIAEKYPRENAVMTQHHEHVEIKLRRGELTATSKVIEETLLLTDVASKIYNQDYVYHGFFQQLEDVEAVTFLPTDKGTKKVKATMHEAKRSESSGIFFDDALQTVVSYAGLQKGAVTSLKYELNHSDIHFLPSFYFQSSMPIIDASFSVTVPKEVELGYVLYGNHQDWVKMEKVEGKRDITYTWSVKDIPKINSYSDAPRASYFIPHLQIYIASYLNSKGEKVAVLNNLDNLYKYFYTFIKDVNIKPDAQLKELSASITKGAEGNTEKAKRIYEWVQSNIRYVAFEDSMGGFVPRQAAMVCSRKFGDCKDMTSIQVALCRLAGVDAHYVWIGTRNKPYKYKEMALPMINDHMICAAKLDGKWVFMDGTNTLSPFGKPPYALQGKEGMIAIDPTHYEIVTVPEIPATENVIEDVTKMHLAGDALEGKIDMTLKGVPAWNTAVLLSYTDSNELHKNLEGALQRGSNKFSASGTQVNMAGNAMKDMTITGNFRLQDYARKVGSEWYINMNLNRNMEDAWIDTSVREVAVEYDYKHIRHQQVVLDIPDGYKVSYTPPDAKMKVPGLWGYKIAYTQKDGKLILDKTFEMDALYLYPSGFAANNKIANSLRTQYKESIVLKAIK